MEKNTAERGVATREAKTWKSHVNRTIRGVSSQFGNLCQATPLTWQTDMRTDRADVIPTCGPAAGGLIVKFLKQSLSLLLSCCLVLASAPGGLAAQADQSAPQAPVQAAPQTPAQ